MSKYGRVGSGKRFRRTRRAIVRIAGVSRSARRSYMRSMRALRRHSKFRG